MLLSYIFKFLLENLYFNLWLDIGFNEDKLVKEWAAKKLKLALGSDYKGLPIKESYLRKNLLLILFSSEKAPTWLKLKLNTSRFWNCCMPLRVMS